MTYDEAAIQIMKKEGAERIWMGHPNLWHEIYERKNGNTEKHPMNQWKAVYQALHRSPLFKITGYIYSPGFTTEREVKHPVFERVHESQEVG